VQLLHVLTGNTSAMLQAIPPNNSVKSIFTDLAIGPAGFWKLLFSTPGLADAFSNPFEISPGFPTALRVIVQPGGAYGGSKFDTQPTIVVLDSGNNVANTTGADLSIVPYLFQQRHGDSNSNQDSNLYLRNGSAAAVQDGLAVFSFLSVDVVGFNYFFLFVMKKVDGQNVTVTSSTFDVLPGAPVAFKINVQPTDCRPGVPFLQQPKLLAVDSGGNAANSTISVQVCK
jgi:hypothetical protein